MFLVLVSLMVVQLTHGDSCTSEYSCASCTEVKICHNTTSGPQEIFRFSCPSTAPYCVAGTCSYIPILDCAPVDSYPCMRDGIFPYPSDCQKYRVCQNGTSYLFTCPSYYYFDSGQNGCVHGASCYTISCSGKTGFKQPYGNDAGIYAYCRDGIAVFVDRCPGAYQLNPSTQQCGPSCPAVGYKIPDPDDCTRYFFCSKEPYATDYTITNMPCPVGSGFDPRYLRCVPLKWLATCNPPAKAYLVES